jgi:hypothetical protein
MSVDGEGVALKILMQVMLYEYYSVPVNTTAMFSCFTGEQNRKVLYMGFWSRRAKSILCESASEVRHIRRQRIQQVINKGRESSY